MFQLTLDNIGGLKTVYNLYSGSYNNYGDVFYYINILKNGLLLKESFEELGTVHTRNYEFNENYDALEHILAVDFNVTIGSKYDEHPEWNDNPEDYTYLILEKTTRNLQKEVEHKSKFGNDVIFNDYTYHLISKTDEKIEEVFEDREDSLKYLLEKKFNVLVQHSYEK